MTPPSPRRNRTALSCFLGCGFFLLFFPICFTISAWFAFALGSMGCSLPDHCSSFQTGAKGILSMVVFLGGGFVLPITTAIYAAKSLK